MAIRPSYFQEEFTLSTCRWRCAMVIDGLLFAFPTCSASLRTTLLTAGINNIRWKTAKCKTLNVKVGGSQAGRVIRAY